MGGRARLTFHHSAPGTSKYPSIFGPSFNLGIGASSFVILQRKKKAVAPPYISMPTDLAATLVALEASLTWLTWARFRISPTVSYLTILASAPSIHPTLILPIGIKAVASPASCAISAGACLVGCLPNNPVGALLGRLRQLVESGRLGETGLA
jgi:hypothetical protein